MPSYLIIGAGFSGAVLARELVEASGCSVVVIDSRDHIGGNCHTERDSESGVMVHRYGPHIFNTNNEKVWNYVNRFGDFRPFTNRVKTQTDRGVFSLPINLLTINQFFGKTMNPNEAREFVVSLGDKTINEPQNFEEQALKMLGRDLYENFFKGYTIKQWGCDPKDLPASVLKRLPIRFNYDDNYYDKKFQGIPADGYTEVIKNILDHPKIKVRLGEKFDISAFSPESQIPDPKSPLRSTPESRIPDPESPLPPFTHLFYTGPIDAFFGYSEGRLGYRTVTFERIETEATDYQGAAVINYSGLNVPFTRIHEHKHFAPWESHNMTVAFREFSKETEPDDIPYYPKRLAADKALLRKYRSLAMELPGNKGVGDSDQGAEVRRQRSEIGDQRSEVRGQEAAVGNRRSEVRAQHQAATETQQRPDPQSHIQHPNVPGVSFLGRLATYRYMDMETVIGEALDFAETFLATGQSGKSLPVFPNQE